MNNYIEQVLKKEKKAVSFETIISKVENLKSKEVGHSVTLTAEEKDEVFNFLEAGVSKYEIYKTPAGNYIAFYKTSFRKGRFYGNRDGAGKVSVTTSYVDKEGKLVVKSDKFDVSRENVHGAIDGDFVLIDTCTAKGNSVVEILDRNLDYVPGEVYRVGSSYFVKPVDKKKQFLTIAINGEAIEGQRVAVSLDKQTAPDFYIGSIVRVFNHKDDPNEDILWEAFKLGVDNDFSNESLEQLEKISDHVLDTDRIGREDFIQHETFTLDAITTKDMDDAVSCYINEKGNYVLGVHITDMSAIIPYDSPLDRDGFRKGNSYYPGGIVLPNYPRKISNGIGSLNPGVDRLAISDILEINPKGEVVSYRLVPSVIRSNLKMSYETVNKIFKEGIIDAEYKPHEETLQTMRKLASILHTKRMRGGALEFDRPEPGGIYSANGHMIGVGTRTSDVAENLIEEFMLVANFNRAKYFQKNGIPCIYRVHDSADVVKVRKFLEMLEAIGLPFYGADAQTLVDDQLQFQKLINHVSGCGRLSSMLLTELIKTQSRAKYSSFNTGHSGLAADCYMQGTSPARRYGDKTNQHIAWDCVFRPDPRGKMRKVWTERLPEIAERITHTERVADDLEKETFRMQCAEYMEQFIGQEFEATVISISGDCLLVQLDNMIEGTVRVRDLKGDYVYSEDSYSLVSLDGKEDYFIGDRLRLKLLESSKSTKKINFEVVEKINEVSIKNSRDINMAVKIKEKERRGKMTGK